MIRKSALLAIAAFGLIVPSAYAADDWSIDPMHSAAHFSIKHMMISTVRVRVKVTGTVNYDGKNLATAKVNATIDAKSINTGEDKRDEHLRGKDFFETEKFPNITFKSTGIKPKAQRQICYDRRFDNARRDEACMTLDVEGSSQQIKDKQGNSKVGFSATGTIKRKDFGVTYNSVLDGGGVALGEEVPITLDVELSKPDGAEKPAAKKG